jgi:hypothetical protein
MELAVYVTTDGDGTFLRKRMSHSKFEISDIVLDVDIPLAERSTPLVELLGPMSSCQPAESREPETCPGP